ncbi:type 2 lanthipeptide synthetase LanM family protein [Halorussus salinus]|uniref:type 2 lanthipeptide synthetase LanM family protein n=1 Tax=Halorussus salinus TaxID=1364935 RepID=UPI001091A0B8|nr:type 2 lanthipeptide synthetase LanM family protein [Halorussus salinus]
MVFSTEEKKSIAGDARTLQERLGCDPDATDRDEDITASLDEQLDEWRERVANGDREAFGDRLERDGLDEQECRRRMAVAGWPDDEPLPGWVEELDELVAFVVENPSPEVEIAADRELPFRDLVEPVVGYARTRVDLDSAGPLSSSAVADLFGWLATRVTGLWSRALFIDFKTHVANENPDLVLGDEMPEPGATRYYDEFVEEMATAERLRSFFSEYSFLGRLLVTVLRQWRARVEEFTARVASDSSQLGRTFADGEDVGAVTGIEVLGDHHNGGRAVFRVAFESGTTVGYKPRNAGIVVGFYELVEWINERGDLPPLQTLEVLYREEYAWMEWVRPAACTDPEGPAEYYRRAGMLMCLFYAFAATDMHLENIVAVGSQPVAIDLETVTEPVAKPEMRRINEAVQVVADTVVRTGVVPRHVPDGDVGDMAGFSTNQASIDAETQQFTNVNTDRMDLENVPTPDREGENLPVYDGSVVGPRTHVDDIVRGFEEMYRFVLDNKAAMLAEGGPIDRLTDREARVRVVYRPTVAYGRIRTAMRSADHLRNGLNFGTRVEVLAKLVVAHDVDPAVWSLYEAERDALREYGTPRFTAELRSTDLLDGDDHVLDDFFVQPPVEQIRDRIEAFDGTDLDEQCDYLRWGYRDHVETHGSGKTTRIDHGRDGRAERDGREDFETLVEETAEGIFDRIEATARRDDGDPVWVLRRVGADGGIDVAPIDDALYDGRVGIGIFLAGLARVFDDERYERLARETVAPILDALDSDTFENDSTSARYPPRPVGGVVGLGSIAYGLTKVGQLLDDSQYFRGAKQVAGVLGDERIAADQQYDVLQGSAGAVLGLVSLYEATGDDEVLDRARRAGDHLLESATHRDGVPTWAPASVGRPVCGFSHGTAGIAYALTRLESATGDSRFGTVAAESLAFERRRFDEETTNWPDLRPTSETDSMDAWCHGRTGIGLARLGTDAVDTTDARLADARRALRGIDPTTAFAADHVCCGNFGRVELLLRAARSLDEPTLRRDAERLAGACVRRADDAGGFSTQWGTEHWYDPGFFGGEAGIGYSLLRTVDPSLPCVLLLE